MSEKKLRVDVVAWSALLAGAVIGLLASFVLSLEALTLAGDPDATLSCSVNLVLNCATVANDSSAELLGFPNSFVGMMAFPVLITIAVVGLTGVKLPVWFLRAMWIGAIGGLIFAGWMFYESYFVIQALCPWCLLTDIAVLMVFYGTFRILARQEILCAYPQKLAQFSRNNYDLLVVLVLVVAAVAAVVAKYGDSLFV